MKRKSFPHRRLKPRLRRGVPDESGREMRTVLLSETPSSIDYGISAAYSWEDEIRCATHRRCGVPGGRLGEEKDSF